MIEAVILYAIAGGIWRRVLGGWLALRRSAIVAAGAALTIPAWLTLPWWEAAVLCGLLALYFLMGHRFDRWSIVLRYPLVGATYPIFRALGVRDWTAVAEVAIGAAGWAVFAAWCFRGVS